jgi:hypothetical protein
MPYKVTCDALSLNGTRLKGEIIADSEFEGVDIERLLGLCAIAEVSVVEAEPVEEPGQVEESPALDPEKLANKTRKQLVVLGAEYGLTLDEEGLKSELIKAIVEASKAPAEEPEQTERVEVPLEDKTPEELVVIGKGFKLELDPGSGKEALIAAILEAQAEAESN